MSFGFRFNTSIASMVGRISNLILLRSALLRTSGMTGNLPWAPVPITSWLHFQGMFSSRDSGVWPNCSRNCLDGFFLRLWISPRSYQRWMERWHIRERFPQPDWSIVDLWLARKLLAIHISTAQVETILRLGSPHFPRHHGDPEDYLRRTLARAARETLNKHVTSL